MPTRHKGKVHETPLEDFLKSDSDDSDFDDASAHARPSRPKSHSKKSKKQKSSRPKPLRRPNREYDSSSVVSDDESIESDEPFTEGELDEPPELNPRTGRPTRNTAKRTAATYAEPDSNEDSSIGESDNSDDNLDELQQPSPQKRNRPKPSLIVTLSVAPEKLQAITMNTRSSRRLRGRSQSASVQPVAEGHQTRRSSRLSAEPEPLLELGRDNKARVTVGGKSPMKAPAKTSGKTPAKTSGKAPSKTSGKVPAKAVKLPSIIMEASQESSIPVVQTEANESDGERQNTTVLVESIETPDEPLTVQHLTDDEDQGANITPADDDDDDDEDGPVRRPSRTKSRKVGWI
jgi:ATPase family AAA domain-containing protein 2